MWKLYQHVIKFIMTTGERGVQMVKRLESGSEQITPDSLRPLRGLHTTKAKEAVLQALSGRNPSLRDLREAGSAALYAMWSEWHWKAGHTQQLIDDEKCMLSCISHVRDTSLCFYFFEL